MNGLIPEAMAQSAGGAAPGGGIAPILMMVVFIAIFYFLLIRPQQKKAKLAKKFQEELQKGDKIVTIAGIHGTVNKVNDDSTLLIETSPGSYLKIEKSAISIEWTQALNKPVATADKK